MQNNNFKIARLLLVGVVILAVLIIGGKNLARIDAYISLVIQDSQDETLEYTEKIEIVIKPGDTFATIMESAGVSYDETEAMLASAKDVYDLTKLHSGKFLHLFLVEEAFAAVDYDLNDEMKIVIEKYEDSFEAREEPIVYDTYQTSAEAVITSSLFVDGAEAGLSDVTLLALADIFAWDIDFLTDIRKGDSFNIVYKKRFLDGEEAGPGNILAARFDNQGVTHAAFYYKDAFGEEGYYDLQGKSLSRQFLKSPLDYSYISSGFSYKRVNPVTKQLTPHRAIDYAADTGTPVIATADGKVTAAGSKGGLGITVEIRHGSYLTQYAHLSRIAKGVENGADVAQGDVIGYVGSTGISTGPHLQYAMFEDDTPINPFVVELPSGEPLEASDMEQFLSQISKLRKKIGK
tara:strand:+ start:86331 stop:87545 length:1215 start_codon:yes stop_codon:yes gene_type:complete